MTDPEDTRDDAPAASEGAPLHDEDAASSEADAPSPVIVGVGASAGGLQAFEEFLSATPARAPVAIVFIQHLEPTHTSHMVDLVRPYTDFDVHQAKDGQQVDAGHVYIGPPGQYVTIDDGVLRLADMGERLGVRYPIDMFLRSLAQDQGERSIGVVLTGTGTDGTAGIKAIKAQGGTVYVQDPETAEHRGMPASAIETDLVDEVLRVDQIPQRIVDYIAHPFIRERPKAQDGDRDAVAPVLELLRSEGTVDFRNYKTLTLKRRIERRMGLNHIKHLSDYRTFLERHPDERERLQKDLLISVTEFFRDREAWEVLADEALPRVLADREEGQPVRAWVAGCATGEEAYTLMMLLLEQLGRDQKREIQAFATDVSTDALAVARAGSYPSGALEQVPQEYVQRYFREVEGTDHHRVVHVVREPVTFAVHDLLHDPPFSRLDIITCRNLLIYLTPEAQARVLRLFHFALRPGGILFLGSAEGRGPAEDGFDIVSKKWRIYRRKEGPPLLHHGARANEDPKPAGRARAAPDTARPAAPARRRLPVAERAKAWLVATYAPAAVVINHHHEILYLHGPLGNYLELPHGEPVLDLSHMPREGLRPHLRAAVREAIQTRQRVDLQQVAVRHDGTTHHVDVRVEPLDEPDAQHPLLIVAFHESAPPTSDSDARPVHLVPDDEKQAAWVQRLEDELQITQEDLRATIEELESSNERLRASNEEILSMNEEFRSTNEELETSKEELQSLNEELTALNTQLRNKVETLEATTNDLENLLRSTDIPTLFLDDEAQIRLFTPSMTRLMNLIPSDKGRPLADITRKFDDPTLVPDLEAVHSELIPRENEVAAHNGHRYLRRIQPYRTTDDRITGTVVTFLDIEGIKRAADAVDVARRYAEGIVETLREPILVLDEGLRVLSANQAFYDTFRYETGEAEGHVVYDLGGGEWDVPALHELLEQVLPVEPRRTDYEIEHEFSKIGQRTMVINAQRIVRPLSADGTTGRATLLAFDDITERKAAAEADAAFKSELERRVRQRTAELERSNRILRDANEALDAFSYVIGHDLKEPTRAIESVFSIIEEDHADELPPGLAPLIKQARAANRRLSALVVGLLRFSRTATPGAAEPAPVHIGDIVEDPDFTARYETLLHERHGTLEVQDPETTVIAEPQVLAQVLANLILNGLKHNPKERPLIRIRTQPPEAQDEVHLVVEDNGPGFPAEVVGSFPKGVSSTREGGFGLVIAKRGVARMQGRIWLDRSPLGGAAVHITLPAAHTAAKSN